MPAGDVAEDVRLLLDVMYNVEYVSALALHSQFTHSRISTLHRILSSLLRADIPLVTSRLMNIARKYFVNDIEAAVVRHFKSE